MAHADSKLDGMLDDKARILAAVDAIDDLEVFRIVNYRYGRLNDYDNAKFSRHLDAIRSGMATGRRYLDVFISHPELAP
jgi:hypothetical protein